MPENLNPKLTALNRWAQAIWSLIAAVLGVLGPAFGWWEFTPEQMSAILGVYGAGVMVLRQFLSPTT